MFALHPVRLHINFCFSNGHSSCACPGYALQTVHYEHHTQLRTMAADGIAKYLQEASAASEATSLTTTHMELPSPRCQIDATLHGATEPTKPAEVPSVSCSATTTAGAPEPCANDTTENEACEIPGASEPTPTTAKYMSTEHAAKHISIVVRLLSGETSELGKLTYLTHISEVQSMVWDWAFERSGCVDSHEFDIELVHNGHVLRQGNLTLGEVGVASGDEIQLIGQRDPMPALVSSSESE